MELDLKGCLWYRHGYTKSMTSWRKLVHVELWCDLAHLTDFNYRREPVLKGVLSRILEMPPGPPMPPDYATHAALCP